MSLKFDLRIGESLHLDGGAIVVTLLEKSGQRARLSVEADKSVSVFVQQEKHAMPEKDGISRDMKEKMLAGAV